MSDPRSPRWPLRLRSGHVVLALLAIIVVTACGNALVADPGRARITADVIDAEFRFADERENLASKAVGNGAFLVEADDFAGGADIGGPTSAGDGLAEGTASQLRAQAPGDNALIIRTANLELEVSDVPAILADANGEIRALGGYVSGSDVFDQGERTWASVVYRVPADRFLEAMAALRGLSDKVVRESTQSQEVTAQVVDLEARITNLEASEEALVEIMERTGRIEDVLAVQLRLEDVRGQIERLQAQLTNVTDQAVNSTLSVTWFTPIAAVAAAQQGWSLATEIDAALAQTVEALQGVASFGVWLAVVALPVLGIPLLLILALLIILRRRIRSANTATPSVSAAE